MIRDILLFVIIKVWIRRFYIWKSGIRSHAALHGFLNFLPHQYWSLWEQQGGKQIVSLALKQETSPVSLQSEHKKVLPSYWKVMNIPFVCRVIIQENITLFYTEPVLKTFLCCLYVTVVNFSMELIMNRSHRFLQSVITVADMILYQHSTKKAACFQFIGSNSMSLPEELLAKYFPLLFFPDEAFSFAFYIFLLI